MKQVKELNDNIKRTNPNVFSVLSKRGGKIYFSKLGVMAQSAEAKDTKINATIGIAVEDDGMSMHLNAVSSSINLNPKNVFPYSTSFGNEELRKLWKKEIFRKNSLLNGETSLPVVTNGLTHGLSIAGYLFVDEGDKIIIPDLCWENYRLVFGNTYGAELETFEFFDKGKFNINGLSKKLQGKGKKIVLLNFPNNPCGYTPANKEVKEIAGAIKISAESGNNIIVIVDDAYFGFVYKEEIFKESIFSYLAGLHENVLAVKIDGSSKEDYAWGLRVGFITFGCKKNSKEMYSALESKAAGAVRATVSNISNLSQSLLVNAYKAKDYEKQKREKYTVLKLRFDEVVNVLKNSKFKDRFEALPFNSGYFMCVAIKNSDASEVRKRLLEKYDTGVIVQGNLLRIAFSSLKKELIHKLFENIYDVCL